VESSFPELDFQARLPPNPFFFLVCLFLIGEHAPPRDRVPCEQRRTLGPHGAVNWRKVGTYRSFEVKLLALPAEAPWLPLPNASACVDNSSLLFSPVYSSLSDRLLHYPAIWHDLRAPNFPAFECLRLRGILPPFYQRKCSQTPPTIPPHFPHLIVLQTKWIPVESQSLSAVNCSEALCTPLFLFIPLPSLPCLAFVPIGRLS